jgi:ribonuclease-3|tara:strand:+ start:2544 stop:3233 length:690 start_codon:yes stop_codon:yes gene_type:complete
VKNTYHQKEISKLLDYQFKNNRLLEEALTHASARKSSKVNNERLEFLGDRVLGLVIAEELLRKNPNSTEGEIATYYNSLVKKETCSFIAKEIGLENLLTLGKSVKRTNDRQKDKILGNAIEALIGAIFLDAGFEISKQLVLKVWRKQIDIVRDIEAHAKTALQEFLQSKGQEPPTYKQISRTGPDHDPDFCVEVVLGSGLNAIGSGSTKRMAETKAAEQILEKIKNINE